VCISSGTVRCARYGSGPRGSPHVTIFLTVMTKEKVLGRCNSRATYVFDSKVQLGKHTFSNTRRWPVKRSSVATGWEILVVQVYLTMPFKRYTTIDQNEKSNVQIRSVLKYRNNLYRNFLTHLKKNSKIIAKKFEQRNVTHKSLETD